MSRVIRSLATAAAIGAVAGVVITVGVAALVRVTTARKRLWWWAHLPDGVKVPACCRGEAQEISDAFNRALPSRSRQRAHVCPEGLCFAEQAGKEEDW